MCVVVPAIRGKDYGKSAMRAGPDYITTDSGLQYKVSMCSPCPSSQQRQLLAAWALREFLVKPLPKIEDKGSKQASGKSEL